MIRIDDTYYNAEWVKDSLEQSADIINGDESGRLQGDKSMYLDYVGTFFNHKGQIRRGKKCTDEEWDNLFLTLANPINDHSVDFPFGQSTIEIQIYISQVVRKLVKLTADSNVWTKVYDVTFTAMESNWLASGDIRGLAKG